MGERVEVVVKPGRSCLYTNEDGVEVTGTPEDGAINMLRSEFADHAALGAVKLAKAGPKVIVPPEPAPVEKPVPAPAPTPAKAKAE